MIVVEPGHRYLVDSYDGEHRQLIQFMKRVGEGYPGNTPPAYPGTNIQELLRVLIHRIEYLQNQVPCWENVKILADLQEALRLVEFRANRRHGFGKIETLPTCPKCGHIVCGGHK